MNHGGIGTSIPAIVIDRMPHWKDRSICRIYRETGIRFSNTLLNLSPHVPFLRIKATDTLRSTVWRWRMSPDLLLFRFLKQDIPTDQNQLFYAEILIGPAPRNSGKYHNPMNAQWKTSGRNPQCVCVTMGSCCRFTSKEMVK